ncbi:MAG TPA: glutathione S-transferase [Solirubrobacterales bacterium]|nr:glutathione S-transferase [Solirubrobacterales bacterium]
MPSEEIKLHVLPPSHPCMTARAALDLKGLEYEVVTLDMGRHGSQVEEIYGEGRRTVPGMIIGEEQVHGSTAILERLDQLVPENPLYPSEIADEVREAELWADGHLQDLGRRLPWGALHFRPESMGTFGGAGPLDPAGVDFAMKFIHGTWKYHGITAAKLAEDLDTLPSVIEEIEGFAGRGLIDGERPTAADLQIGSTVRVLLTVGDLHPSFEGTAAERIARRHFPEYDGLVPAGAFPTGWI